MVRGFFSLLALSMVTLLSTGCGELANQFADTNTKINSFSVEGTSGAGGNGVPINSGVNGGNFKLKWDISSSDPYHVEVYISDNQTLQTGDIKFFSQNCGSNGAIYSCGTSASLACQFTTENKILCGPVTASNPGKNLTTFLDQLPKSAYIIIEACNGLRSSCEKSSSKIELR